MNLTVNRQPPKDGAVLGELLIDGAHECFTLERTMDEGKGHIPAGRYKVVIDWSPAFNQNMPHVLDVPGFEGIRIHWGNTWKDTEGCLILGETEADAFVGQSRAAFAAFFPKLEAALQDGGECWIEYVDP